MCMVTHVAITRFNRGKRRVSAARGNALTAQAIPADHLPPDSNTYSFQTSPGYVGISTKYVVSSSY